MVIQETEPNFRAETALKPRLIVTLLKEIVTWTGMLVLVDEERFADLSDRQRSDSRRFRFYPKGSTVSAWQDGFGNTYLFDPVKDWYISVTAKEGVDYEVRVLS